MTDLDDVQNLPVVQEVKETLPAIQQPEESKADEDFELVRSNLKELTDKGTWALDDLIELAKTSQHPKAFEVVAALIKTLADTNVNIMDAHLKLKLTKKTEKGEAPPPGTTNNNIEKAVFVGSTADLQRMIKGEIDGGV